MMLIPGLAGVGALILTGTMLGAVLTEAFVIDGNALRPLPLLVIVALVAYGRREQMLRLLRR